MARHAEAEFAWPGGDRPGRLEFSHDPPEPVRAAIRTTLGTAFEPARDPGARLAALVADAGPAGRYRLTSRGGSWFVRVSSRWGQPDLEKSVADHLAAAGVSVCPILVTGLPLEWNDLTYRIDVRPLIQGHHFDGSIADVDAVAAALGRCHVALRTFPRRDEVRAAAVERNRKLAEARGRLASCLERDRFDELAESADWARLHRDWLLEMVEQLEPHMERWPAAQCVHGQMHTGNVIFRAGDGEAVLVDMEEAAHLVAPAAWDLAFLVQRFCLADNPSRPTLAARLARIGAAYGSALPPLAPMMRQAAWFNVALILQLRLGEGLVTPLEEYDKFVGFERQATRYADAL